MANVTTRPFRMLLVDDDAGDVLLMQEALAEGGLGNTISPVRDGVEALAYLRGVPPYANAPKADVVLLDLNMPRMSGREVLIEMRRDPTLRGVPVIVLTTSTSPADIRESYSAGANLYINKTLELDRFLLVVRQLEHFLSTVVRLPGAGS